MNRSNRLVPFALGLAAVTALAGCGDSDSPAGATSSSTSSSTTSNPTTPSPGSPATSSDPAPSSVPSADKTIEVTITGRTVDPAPASVELESGQTLRLVVTADHDDELHAHGFDVEEALTAGQPTTVDLTAGEPGQYEVETHHPELTLLTVLVR